MKRVIYRKPYRFKKKKSIFKNRFFWLTILILIILGGIFYLICFSSFFQVRKIEIVGNQKTETEKLLRNIEKKLEKKIFFFPSQSIFLVNLKEINNLLLEKFPQVASVNLKRRFPDALSIEIKEREPVAIFSQQEKNFFIDKEGVIFEEIFQEEWEMFKIKKLNLGKALNLGEKVVLKEELAQILEFGQKLKEDLKISPIEFLIISEEGINIKTSENWEIYFNPIENTEWQLTKLKAVLEKEIPQEKRKDLEYIDLRFGNFAPYKYR